MFVMVYCYVIFNYFGGCKTIRHQQLHHMYILTECIVDRVRAKFSELRNALLLIQP
jgi:hypothetical protein